MSVNALGPYEFAPRDQVKNFHGNILVNFCWDRHVLVSAPFAVALPPAMTLREAIMTRIAPSIAFHPDAAKIDWNIVQWEKDHQPWQPDLDKSLAENKVGHKDYLLFITPELKGLNNAGL